MEELPPGFLSLGRGPRGGADFTFPTTPPPPLFDEIVEEILLRVPPDDPARLLRAALVCKRWAGLVTDAGFRRRYGERYRTPPLLGILGNLIDTGGFARFVPTGDFRPAIADHHAYRAHDARDGRVLLNGIGPARKQRAALAVWDPITGEHRDLPLLPRPQQVRSWNAAVLGRRPGPFRVAFVGMDAKEMFAHVYSSDSAAWSEAASAQLPDDHLDESLTGAPAGNAFYFVFEKGTGLLEFDLGARRLSAIALPNKPYQGRIVLMAMEGGRLGFAVVDALCTLRLWSMEVRPGGKEGRWAVSRVIELRKQLPYHVFGLVAAADDAGVVFVSTTDGLYAYDLKSGQGMKVMSNRFYGIVPYASFYTPVLRVGLTSERPSAGSSID